MPAALNIAALTQVLEIELKMSIAYYRRFPSTDRLRSTWAPPPNTSCITSIGSPSVEQQLIEVALRAQQNAYAPYSKFVVGAAIRTTNGVVVGGCNFENASYGLAICAERAAVGAMIATGEREIQSVVVVSVGGVTPCGACRQVLAEFGSDCEVVLYDSSQQIVSARWRMSELLPGAFKLR